MQNVLSASNLYTELIDTEQQKISHNRHTPHDKSFVSSKVLLESESISFSIGNKGHLVFSQAFKANLSIEISTTNTESYRAFSEFELPTPSEVANNILGFIENRLQSEIKDGASQERVVDLLNQAREGVKKGFAMAQGDIESLGLMDADLDAEIDNSFNLVKDGLNRLKTRFILNNNTSEKVDDENEHLSNQKPIQKNHSEVNHDLIVNENTQFKNQNSLGKHHHAQGLNKKGLSFNAGSYTQIDSNFSLTTQDGDIVSFSLARADADYLQSAAFNNTERLIFTTRKLEAFELSVQGNLDESEIIAINELLEQVNEISELFFEDDFQAAFLNALNIGFDGSEIAEFSLNLSKIQVEEVRAYGNYSPGASSNVLANSQPLVDMANRLGQAVNLMNQFESRQFELRELIQEFIDQQRKARNESTFVSNIDFLEFTSRTVELLVG